MKIDSKKLKIAMARKCMCSRELAKKCGLSFSTICSYMNGKKAPNLKSLGKIAKALDVDPETLID